jgi:hypothetical protein
MLAGCLQVLRLNGIHSILYYVKVRRRFPKGTRDFSCTSQTKKSFNQSICNFNLAHFIKLVRSPNSPKKDRIKWLEAALQIGEVCSDVNLFYLPFLSNSPTDQSAEPICMHKGSNDMV